MLQARWAMATVIVLTAVVTLSCSRVSKTSPPPSPNNDLAPATLDVTSVHIENRLLSFGGTSTLPEGTLLQSQFYENEVPVSWWPTSTIQVKDGKFEFVFGGDTVPILVGGARYRIRVWARDDPAIEGNVILDLSQYPPSPIWL